MSDSARRDRSALEGAVDRRRFLKYSSAVTGLGLGSTSALADDESESEPEGELTPEPGGDGVTVTDSQSIRPDEEVEQKWFFTITCPGPYCEPGPFAVTGITQVEHVQSGSTLPFEEKTWTQGYETVERTWDLGTPAEWADQLGLDSPDGNWKIQGLMLVDGVLSDFAELPITVECPLKPEIEAKRARIGTIRNLAGEFVPPDSVDQEAESLLDTEIADEDDCADTDDEDELEQYEEALNRMNSAETITESATSAVAGPGRPIDRIAELLVETVKNKAAEYITRGVGRGVLRFLDRISTRALEAISNVLDSYAGRGVINEETHSSLQRYLNGLSATSYYVIESIQDGTHEDFDPDDDPWETIVDEAGSGTIEGTKELGDQIGITGAIESRLDEVFDNAREQVKEILFTGYYQSPWVSELHVPAPSEIELPDIDETIDLPTQYLPDWILNPDPPGFDPPGIPEQISIDIETPDVPLPEVPVFTDVHDIREGISVNTDSPAGVNASIDQRMQNLEQSLGSLDQQTSGARNHVEETFAGGIDAISDVTDAIHANLDTVGGYVSWLEDQASNLTTGLLIAAGLLFVSIKGIPLAINAALAAVKLAAYTLVLTITQVVLDGIQAIGSAAVATYYANLHHIGAVGIVEDDLGGVSNG